MIRILIVDDSTINRAMLRHVFEQQPDMVVVGEAVNGLQAIEMAETCSPDIITMDIFMPVLNGFDATRNIMSQKPIPIVILSASIEPGEVELCFHALEAGAVTAQQLPSTKDQASIDNLLSIIRTMSSITVHSIPTEPSPNYVFKTFSRSTTPVVAIGSSTGGPPILQKILSRMPEDYSFPIAIVQHIAKGFTTGLVEWLNASSQIEVKMAVNDEQMRPGTAYLAPDDYHMKVSPERTIVLSQEPPQNDIRPAVSKLFESLAKNCCPTAIGVILTGIGSDGAKELKMMKDAGAINIAQDIESSIVFDMPRAAIQLGAVNHILPPCRIASQLIAMAKQYQTSSESVFSN
ncbi:MAG TPA: chemotaxis-specific protein-glutamate methyltransferase CheB [Phycisphaerae bacterium]|nr:chemotaxis-specific protein-glutamate methyltransferase CheB [Phycisphaerae bacterium]HPS53360.1 chemotaxis-specific protein-glutamate methyltransferase CheB [Phycisphaerae bacterium]